MHGIIRRNSQMGLGALDRLPGVREHVLLHHGDITDASFLDALFRQEKFDEVYHLAAQSFVGYSFANPQYTYVTNVMGTINVLEAVRKNVPDCRVYNAATSEMYGRPVDTPQDERTPFAPCSPYAVSKLAAYWQTEIHKQSGLFACSGICFNHESELRGPEFVTRKISRYVAGFARASGADQQPLALGNTEARKDWGYSPDFVRAMWLMLQQKEPRNYVLGTGKQHTVRQFVESAFACIGLELYWEGCGVKTRGLVQVDGKEKVVVVCDPLLFRPIEADNYCADFTRARKELGWTPTVEFERLVAIMVESDLNETGERRPH